MVPLCTGEECLGIPGEPLEILFVCTMNDNHRSCVDPDGIDYFVLDHSRRTSDLHHCGDYADCWNTISVHRPSGDDKWLESFARDSLNL